MQWARIVAVLVPSPTRSPVFSAAWRSICAPRFSSGSSSCISFAMVTPSLQTSGEPHCFWMSTDLDLGPSVMRTASASSEAPRSTFSRAAERNSTCLAVIRCPRSRYPSGESCLRPLACPGDPVHDGAAARAGRTPTRPLARDTRANGAGRRYPHHSLLRVPGPDQSLSPPGVCSSASISASAASQSSSSWPGTKPRDAE